MPAVISGQEADGLLLLGALTGFGVVLLAAMYARARATRGASPAPYATGIAAVVAFGVLAGAGVGAAVGLAAVGLNVLIAAWALTALREIPAPQGSRKVFAAFLLIVASAAAVAAVIALATGRT